MSQPRNRRAGLLTLIATAILIVLQSGCSGSSSLKSDTQSGSPAISTSPASVQFGSVAVGTSVSQPIVLSNTGTASLTVTQIALSGQEFSLSEGVLPMKIAAGGNAVITAGFAPSATGNASGSISITSNASNGLLTVSLSGSGASGTSAAASVSLNWMASVSADVIGYDVYRGTQADSYTQINSSLVAGTSYVDSTVESGHNITYYYSVTSVSSGGKQSGYSSPVVVLVP